MGLIPTLLSSFMVDVAQRVIVENFDIDKFLTGILDSAPAVARHTPVVHIKKTDSGVESSKYVWTNKFLQPWGQTLPSQCPACFSFRPWPSKGSTKNNASIVFKCAGMKSDNTACEKELRFPKPEYKSVSPGGMWLSFNWP